MAKKIVMVDEMALWEQDVIERHAHLLDIEIRLRLRIANYYIARGRADLIQLEMTKMELLFVIEHRIAAGIYVPSAQ